MQQRLPERGVLRTELNAGLTFALVNIPQGMANALLALVNPVSGLYMLMLGTPVAAMTTGSVLMNVSTTSELIGDGRVLADTPQLGVAANRALLDAYTWLAKPVRYAEGVAR